MISMFEVKSRLDDMGITYHSYEDDKQLTFEITGKRNNRTIVGLLLNNEDNEAFICFRLRVNFFTYNIKIAKTINEYNSKYKWYQFYIDDKNELMMKINLDCRFINDEENILEYIARGLAIIEEIYPETQRLLWAE